ncbi:MAG: cupin domain-containing protein [Methanomicrobiales archaeon]|nr:cupin domain-containing protein [Methanomicrobiales archaeon]
MDIHNIPDCIARAPLDPKGGIRITRVTGDETCSFYAAEIAVGTKLRPHYHRHGIELYQILSGTGTMKTGRKIGAVVRWDEKFSVGAGDCFTIAEGMVHQLANNGNVPLRAAFVCPVAHLGNDRFFIR